MHAAITTVKSESLCVEPRNYYVEQNFPYQECKVHRLVDLCD